MGPFAVLIELSVSLDVFFFISAHQRYQQSPQNYHIVGNLLLEAEALSKWTGNRGASNQQALGVVWGRIWGSGPCCVQRLG